MAFSAQKTPIASGNWSDSTIWSPAVVPDTSDNVVISNSKTVTVDIAVKVNSLKVANYATLIINQPLTVSTGDVILDGSNLTKVTQIVNNSTLTILNGGVICSCRAHTEHENIICEITCALINNK